MFLTRFPINMTRRQSKAMLASPYRIHAAIAGSFPPKSADELSEQGRVLWRVDTNQDGSSVLYIVSPQIPSLVGLDEQIGWSDLDHQWATRDYAPLLNRIREGQRYAFRLTANPVINRVHITNGKNRSKRIGHLTPLHFAAWLVGDEAFAHCSKETPAGISDSAHSRAAKNGFEVCKDNGNLQLVVSNNLKQTIRTPKSDKPITLTRAQFDGMLVVRDAEKLRHALCFGIGHAKAFGCGLMTLVPVDA